MGAVGTLILICILLFFIVLLVPLIIYYKNKKTHAMLIKNIESQSVNYIKQEQQIDNPEPEYEFQEELPQIDTEIYYKQFPRFNRIYCLNNPIQKEKIIKWK